MKEFFSNPTTWLWAGVIFTLLAVVFGIRAIRGRSNSNIGPDTLRHRRNVAVALVALAVISWIVYGAMRWSNSNQNDPDDPPVCTCTEECTEDSVNEECPVCAEDYTKCVKIVAKPAVTTPTAEYLEAVSLTEDQINDFLSQYNRIFTKRSLAGINRENRIAAVTKYMVECKESPFTEAVNYPVKEWFTRFDELLNKELTVDERLALQKDFYKALDQEMISNVPFGIMILEGMKEIPYIYQNNADWIDGNLKVIDQFFAGTYVQPTDKESLKIELNKIPTLDTDEFIGLDYFVVHKSAGVDGGLLVREEWARLVARMSSALRCYTLRMEGDMVVERASTLSWRDCSTAEDSKVRMVKDDQSESRDVIVLSGIAKSGTERTLIGINRFDSRLEIFTPGTPDKPKTQTPPKQDPPKTETPKTYKVTRWAVDTSGNTLRAEETVYSGLSNGTKKTVSAYTIADYELVEVYVGSSKQANVGSANVTINGANVKVKFVYKPTAKVQYYTLYGEWGYYNNETWVVLQKAATLGQYKAGDRYSHTTGVTFTGYKALITHREGDMPAQDTKVLFVYEPLSKYNLYGEYGYYDSSNKWHELQNKQFLGSYYAGDPYSVTAPSTLGGYQLKTAVPQTGKMPERDYTIRFVYEKGTYTLYARYGYYSGGRWVDLIGQKTIGSYSEGYEYKVYPERIANWSPVEPYLRGKMPAHDYTLYFEYVKGTDGNGVKNPLEDPVHNGDANIGGGDNQVNDGEGKTQTTKPAEQDYPGTDAELPGYSDQSQSAYDPNADMNDGTDAPSTNTPLETNHGTTGDVQQANPGSGVTPGQTVNPSEHKPVGGSVDSGW